MSEFWATSGPQALVAASWAVGIGVLCSARRAVQKTTLVAPAWWAAAALTSVCGSEMLIAAFAGGAPEGRSAGDPLWIEPLRYAAGCLTFCPVMAVLGAKRPQDRHWWLIVLSLWVVLSLPSLESLLLQPGQALEVRDARSWFLLLLIMLSVSQWLPTRRWMSSLILGAGQVAILAPQLPGAWAGAPAAGCGCFAAALALATRRRPGAATPLGWNRVWLDFRDAFGLLWALRVAERLNAAAEVGGWPSSLHWEGWRPDEPAEAPAAWDAATRESRDTAVRGILRRFVPPEWIDQRLAPSDGSPRGAAPD